MDQICRFAQAEIDSLFTQQVLLTLRHRGHFSAADRSVGPSNGCTAPVNRRGRPWACPQASPLVRGRDRKLGPGAGGASSARRMSSSYPRTILPPPSRGLDGTHGWVAQLRRIGDVFIEPAHEGVSLPSRRLFHEVRHRLPSCPKLRLTLSHVVPERHVPGSRVVHHPLQQS